MGQEEPPRGPVLTKTGRMHNERGKWCEAQNIKIWVVHDDEKRLNHRPVVEVVRSHVRVRDLSSRVQSRLPVRGRPRDFRIYGVSMVGKNKHDRIACCCI